MNEENYEAQKNFDDSLNIMDEVTKALFYILKKRRPCIKFSHFF